MPEIPAVYLDIIWKFALSLIVLVVTLGANRAISSLLRKQIKETAHRHTLRMLIRNGVLILGAIIILVIWSGFGSSFTVAMGILAGYLNIVTGDLFRISDRVRIGNVVGDVLDISLLRTVVMEIGEWVEGDQYTGPICGMR